MWPYLTNCTFQVFTSSLNCETSFSDFSILIHSCKLRISSLRSLLLHFGVLDSCHWIKMICSSAASPSSEKAPPELNSDSSDHVQSPSWVPLAVVYNTTLHFFHWYRPFILPLFLHLITFNFHVTCWDKGTFPFLLISEGSLLDLSWP